MTQERGERRREQPGEAGAQQEEGQERLQDFRKMYKEMVAKDGPSSSSFS